MRVRRRVSRYLALRISCISRLLMLLASLAILLRAAKARHAGVSTGGFSHTRTTLNGLVITRLRKSLGAESRRVSVPVRDTRTVGRCHLKTEAILWPRLPYHTGNNSSTAICSDKLLCISPNTSRLCMNHFITRSHSHGCDKKVAR